MEKVEVGMFRLPGISLKGVEMHGDLIKEMTAWAKENNCGTLLGPGLWSFRNEKQRDWFILRWSEHIPQKESK